MTTEKEFVKIRMQILIKELNDLEILDFGLDEALDELKRVEDLMRRRSEIELRNTLFSEVKSVTS